tara:strand:+ start:3117 stop:3884 length:768 start_codon:yes stop_codon:yes gene_type:complete
VSDYLSDEEQLGRIRGWWNEYGIKVALVVGLVIVAAGIWKVVSDGRVAAAQEGSAAYALYLDGTAESKLAQAQLIREEFAGSTFHVMVALDEAAAAVTAGDASSAEILLQEALTAARGSMLADLVQLRLAKVQYALGRGDEALAALQRVTAPGYLPLALELRGDMLFAEGSLEQAHATYQAAIDALPEGEARPLLQIKMENSAPLGDQYAEFTQPLDAALKKAAETLAEEAARAAEAEAEEETEADTNAEEATNE